MSTVEFYRDKAEEHRWHIFEDDESGAPAAAPHSSKRIVMHACHEGFSSDHNSKQNLFINHALMSIFVAGVARADGKPAAGNVYFEGDADERIRWKIRADNGEIVGMAHKSFDDTFDAMDNLIITYTMLTVFVASVAQERASSLGED